MQQVTGVPDVQRLGDGRQVGWAEVDAQCVGPLAQQGCDAVSLTHLLSLQLRHAGLNGGQTGICAHYVQLIAHAGIAQAFGDRFGVLLVFQVGQCDPLTQLRAPQFTIGIDQLGDHRDLQLIQIGGSHLFIGIAGFQLTLNSAKQVDFPRHVQTQIVTLAVDALLRLAWHLAFTQIAAGTAGNGWHRIVADVIANGACRTQPGKGHTQFTVTGQ